MLRVRLRHIYDRARTTRLALAMAEIQITACCHFSHFVSRYTSGLLRSRKPFFSSHGLSCVAMDMFPERQALCLVDVKQVYYDWPRAPIADKWIPFGEHPLKLERYRED